MRSLSPAVAGYFSCKLEALPLVIQSFCCHFLRPMEAGRMLARVPVYGKRRYTVFFLY
jgi:hypothetical protein